MDKKALVIATIGTFDGVHLGHQALLEQLKNEARKLGMRPAIVTFDPSPSIVLHTQTEQYQLSTTNERVQLLRLLGFEEIILLNFDQRLAQMTSLQFMSLLKEKYSVGALLLGYDHRFGSDGSLSFEQYGLLGAELGIRVLKSQALCHAQDPISSSRIRGLLLSGKIQEANRLLGRNYVLSGQVVGGMQIGRSLGYPTANIKPDDEYKLLPKDGVYAVKISLERCVCGERYTYHYGMLYIGNRPTLGGGLSRTIEVNIFDLEANLYAKHLRIDFVDYVRGNQRFNSLSELQEQIALDEKFIRQLFGM